MRKHFFSIVLLVGAAGFVGYLALTGVTVADAQRWVERKIGGPVDTKDLKGAASYNYSPIVR